MKSIYRELNKKETSLPASILRVSLLWGFLTGIINIYFIIDMNPAINDLATRLYLFLFCFINSFVLNLLLSITAVLVFSVFRIRVYREYYDYIFSFFIILANAGFLIINYIRIGRGNIVDIFSPWFIIASVFCIIILSFLIILLLILSEKLLSHLSLIPKILALFLFASAGFYIIYSGADSSSDKVRESFAEEYEVSATPNRVIFIAADALSFTVLDRMFEDDMLPNLRFLHEHGSSYSLSTIEPAKSPVIWNSIYTSMLPEEHGIVDFSMYKMPFFPPVNGKVKFPKMSMIHYIVKLYERLDINRILIYNSTHRKCKAIWDILSEKGKRSSVLGGWVTYPVYAINGNMVSPQYTYSIEDLFLESDHTLPDVYPPDIDPKIRECRIDPDSLSFADIAYYLNISEKDFLNLNKTRLMQKNLELLRWISAQDETFFCVSKSLWKDSDYDFMFLYYQQTDVLAHQYWHYFQPEYFPEIDREEMDIFRDVIFRSYQKVDDYIGYVMENYTDENTVLVIASDHGMLPTGSFIKSGDHLYGKPEGVMFMYNPVMINPGNTVKEASIYDIAPTILYLLGFPHAEDFNGRILFDAFSGEVLEKITYRKIQSYGKFSSQALEDIDNAKQDKAIEQMKSLGYIQ